MLSDRNERRRGGCRLRCPPASRPRSPPARLGRLADGGARFSASSTTWRPERRLGRGPRSVSNAAVTVASRPAQGAGGRRARLTEKGETVARSEEREQQHEAATAAEWRACCCGLCVAYCGRTGCCNITRLCRRPFPLQSTRCRCAWRRRLRIGTPLSFPRTGTCTFVAFLQTKVRFHVRVSW